MDGAQSKGAGGGAEQGRAGGGGARTRAGRGAQSRGAPRAQNKGRVRHMAGGRRAGAGQGHRTKGGSGTGRCRTGHSAACTGVARDYASDQGSHARTGLAEGLELLPRASSFPPYFLLSSSFPPRFLLSFRSSPFPFHFPPSLRRALPRAAWIGRLLIIIFHINKSEMTSPQGH